MSARTRVTSPPGTYLLRRGGLSVLVTLRPLLASLVLAIGALLAAGLSLSAGIAGLDPITALRAAAGDGSREALVLVQALRLPRIEAGFLVGAGLGIGGCLLQTLAGNRLATPETTGINEGATAFAVASVVGVSASLDTSGMALAGAATAAALALGLGGGMGTHGYRFIVVGLGVGAMLAAATNLMLARSSIDAANAAWPWTVGSLSARPATPVVVLAVGLLVCLPPAVLLSRRLRVMRLPEAVAAGLGTPIRRVRAGTLAVAVTVSGLAVAVGGPIGMVALAAPEAARRLAGPRGVPVVAAGLAGGVMVLLADLAGRTAFAPLELPAGLVCAILGGPYLLWVLLRGGVR